jgi:ActR/RegA family two-component response regulator
VLQPVEATPPSVAGLRVAIFEPAETWCRWLQQAVPAHAGAQVFDSAQALLAALQTGRFEVLIVAFRPRDTDGYAWLRALRASPGGADGWLIVCIGAGDVTGASLARMAGASAVYCKVVDARALSQALATRLPPPAPGPGLPTPSQPLPAAAPLFDPAAMRGPGLAIDERFLAFSFIAAMVDHVDLLPGLYGMPVAVVLLPLEAFAIAARFAGALRLADYTDLVQGELQAGGQLHPELQGEYVGLIAETGREIAAWLLERPARAA